MGHAITQGISLDKTCRSWAKTFLSRVSIPVLLHGIFYTFALVDFIRFFWHKRPSTPSKYGSFFYFHFTFQSLQDGANLLPLSSYCSPQSRLYFLLCISLYCRTSKTESQFYLGLLVTLFFTAFFNRLFQHRLKLSSNAPEVTIISSCYWIDL